MDDFIVISDDSGPESYGEATSSRARRLRRALSRGSGALPRRTVVSERGPPDLWGASGGAAHLEAPRPAPRRLTAAAASRLASPGFEKARRGPSRAGAGRPGPGSPALQPGRGAHVGGLGAAGRGSARVVGSVLGEVSPGLGGRGAGLRARIVAALQGLAAQPEGAPRLGNCAGETFISLERKDMCWVPDPSPPHDNPRAGMGEETPRAPFLFPLRPHSFSFFLRCLKLSLPNPSRTFSEPLRRARESRGWGKKRRENAAPAVPSREADESCKWLPGPPVQSPQTHPRNHCQADVTVWGPTG